MDLQLRDVSRDGGDEPLNTKLNHAANTTALPWGHVLGIGESARHCHSLSKSDSGWALALPVRDWI